MTAFVALPFVCIPGPAKAGADAEAAMVPSAAEAVLWQSFASCKIL